MRTKVVSPMSRKPEKRVDSEGDAARRKYMYRRLVMNQGVKLPARLAMKLVGPDCAFHLYSQHMPNSEHGDTGEDSIES